MTDEQRGTDTEQHDDGTSGVSRGTFLRRTGIAIGTVLVVGAGALGYRAYDQGVLEVGEGPAYAPWSNWDQHAGLLPLVGAATLAPSPHNAQAWLFRLAPDGIDLFADPGRNTGAVDPFRREMYVGLGAALENIVLAANARGYLSTVTLMPDGPHSTHAARIGLRRANVQASALYRQIAKRHSNRYPYVEGKELPGAALRAMQSLAIRETPDARLFWFTGQQQLAQLGELMIVATRAIAADPSQSRSDYAWFRQSWDEIQRKRDGITVDAAGLSDLTAALAKLLPAQSREATDASWLSATRDRQTRTAAAYGIVAVRDATDNGQRVQGGRLLQRIHLWTSGNGFALQHMNQLTERADRERQLGAAPDMGNALSELVPTDWQPLSMFRAGYPTREPHRSPRRAVDAVILA